MAEQATFERVKALVVKLLGVAPEKVTMEARFREDLEADSLDLYTLVQELEDSYGVRISDEQAAKIRTVGQAVEYVLAVSGGETHASASASAGPDAE